MGASAYATVVGNVFEFNRHALTSQGHAYSGYVARFNYVLRGSFTYGSSGYYGVAFDVHGAGYDERDRERGNWYGGGAGEFHEIAFNSVRGEQQYGDSEKTRVAFILRGKPSQGAISTTTSWFTMTWTRPWASSPVETPG